MRVNDGFHQECSYVISGPKAYTIEYASHSGKVADRPNQALTQEWRQYQPKPTLATAPIGVEGNGQSNHFGNCVSDGGPSILPETLAYIVDRFYVIVNAHSYNSTGLGLAIAKTLVEGQNGQLHVTRHVGQGTTFKVLLSCL